MIKSKKNIEYVKSLNCLVCNKKPCDAHHLKTRGSGGDDSLENLIPLCRQHHVEIHQIGKKTFKNKYKLDF